MRALKESWRLLAGCKAWHGLPKRFCGRRTGPNHRRAARRDLRFGNYQVARDRQHLDTCTGLAVALRGWLLNLLDAEREVQISPLTAGQ